MSSVPSEADFVHLLEQLAAIRTPLNGLVAMIDSLKPPGLNELQIRFAQSARHSADALMKVINDISDFSKITSNNIRVLIAEPDPAHRPMVAEQLNTHYSSSSMVVDCANLIETMTSAIATGSPFAVVMLPFAGEIGFALRKAIAADAKLNNAQFVAVLDSSDHASAAIAAEEGFAACLHRPFTTSKIVDAVNRAMGLQQQPAELAAALANLVDNKIEEPAAIAPAAPDVVSEVIEESIPPAPVAPMVSVAVEEPLAPEPAAAAAVIPDVVNEPATPPLAADIPVISAVTIEPAPPPTATDSSAEPIALNEPAPSPNMASGKIFAAKVSEPVQAPTPAPLRSVPPVKPSHPPIDIDNLLSRCMHDADFARRTLEKFQTRATADIEKLRQITQQGDTAQIKRIAASLKAVSAHVAADSIRDIAFEIEQLSMAADREKIAGQLKRLNDEAQRCAEFIPSAIAQLIKAGEKAKGR